MAHECGFANFGMKEHYFEDLKVGDRFKSEPLDAAVADVFGTLSVAVVISRIFAAGRPSSRIAMPRVFVCNPWPISVPP